VRITEIGKSSYRTHVSIGERRNWMEISKTRILSLGLHQQLNTTKPRSGEMPGCLLNNRKMGIRKECVPRSLTLPTGAPHVSPGKQGHLHMWVKYHSIGAEDSSVFCNSKTYFQVLMGPVKTFR
jgi:hypothetical protein